MTFFSGATFFQKLAYLKISRRFGWGATWYYVSVHCSFALVQENPVFYSSSTHTTRRPLTGSFYSHLNKRKRTQQITRPRLDLDGPCGSCRLLPKSCGKKREADTRDQCENMTSTRNLPPLAGSDCSSDHMEMMPRMLFIVDLLS